MRTRNGALVPSTRASYPLFLSFVTIASACDFTLYAATCTENTRSEFAGLAVVTGLSGDATFSFTGGFGVSAALGGAVTVVVTLALSTGEALGGGGAGAVAIGAGTVVTGGLLTTGAG